MAYNLPNRKINGVELENIRREYAKKQGIRYYKLGSRQLIDEVVSHNQKFNKKGK